MTNALLAYVESSALTKLVLREPESAALANALRAWPRQLVSELATTEVFRAAARYGDVPRAAVAVVLRGVALRALRRRTLRLAGELHPVELRSLDAIHLVTALELAPHVGAFFTYDRRLGEAAARHGLNVLAPA